jgi:hypothetical protein
LSSSDLSGDLTDYDVCKARYQLLYDRERRQLPPEVRARYERQLNDSVWGPLTARSLELEGADREQVFEDYARVALESLALPFLPHAKSVARLVKVVRF